MVLMAGEFKEEEAKKEIEDILATAKAEAQKSKQVTMSPKEKEALEQENKKAEELRIKTEEQAKKDAELVAKKDEEISNVEDKKRKAELLEKQRKEEESKLSAEEKIKRIEEKTQRRIDEITNKLKEVTDKSSKEALVLKQEIEVLRKEKTAEPKENLVSVVEKEEAEKNKKYLEEDTSLPREKRREMTDDEIDEWLLEDQKSAIAWIQRREFRREVDKRQNLYNKQKENLTKDLFVKQSNSYAKVLIKHPELDVKARKNELKNQEKSDDEIEDILINENNKYKILNKIAEENPDWKFIHNAPELAMEEMEKRINTNSDNAEKTTIEKMQEQIEELSAEIQRLTSTDVGITSTISRPRRVDGKLTEIEEMITQTMRDSGASQTMIDSAIKKHRERNPNEIREQKYIKQMEK